MGWPTAILLIVVAGIIGQVLTARYRAMHGIIEDEDGNQSFVQPQQPPLQQPHSQGNDPATEREMEDLRERVKVLERLATDGHSLDAQDTRQIAAEIEALREKKDS